MARLAMLVFSWPSSPSGSKELASAILIRGAGVLVPGEPLVPEGRSSPNRLPRSSLARVRPTATRTAATATRARTQPRRRPSWRVNPREGVTSGPVGAGGRPGEGGGHRLDGLEAVVGVGGHGLADDGVQVAGDPGPQGPRRDGGRGVDPGRPGGEHLVQAGPETVDVGPAVGVVAPDDLGGQVAVDPEDLAGAAGVVLGGRPGDREVGHLYRAALGQA